MSAAQVGAQLSGRTVTISRERIRRYAAASRDDNPIHLNDEAAVAGGLPGVIAHGMLGMGLLGTLAAEWAGAPDRVRSLGCRFVSIVLPDDTLTYSGTVAAVDGDTVRVDVAVVNQRGEPVLSRAFVVYEARAV